jgi:hypothetical protein
METILIDRTGHLMMGCPPTKRRGNYRHLIGFAKRAAGSVREMQPDIRARTQEGLQRAHTDQRRPAKSQKISNQPLNAQALDTAA